MSELKKLTSEELELVKQIKKEYTNLAILLGELELQKINIDKERNHLLTVQSQLTDKETKLAQELTEKYGNGSINIDTGEITV